MHQPPTQYVVLKSLYGVALVDVAQEYASSGPQHPMDVVQQFDNELVVEIVDQSHAVDEVLRRKVELLFAHCKVDQIALHEIDLMLQTQLVAPVSSTALFGDR